MKRYRLGKGVRKGILAAASIATGMVAGVEAIGGLDGVGRVTAITGVSALVAAIRMGWNYYKVNEGFGRKKIRR